MSCSENLDLDETMDKFLNNVVQILNRRLKQEKNFIQAKNMDK